MVSRDAEAFPAGTTGILGCSPPGSALPACGWACPQCIPSSVAGLCSITALRGCPLAGMRTSSQALQQIKNTCVLNCFSPAAFQLAFSLQLNGVCLCAAQVSHFLQPWRCPLPMPPVSPRLVPEGLYEPPRPQAPCGPPSLGLEHTSPSLHPNWHPLAMHWQRSLGPKCSPAAKIAA